jgi:hypothetical protein
MSNESIESINSPLAMSNESIESINSPRTRAGFRSGDHQGCYP